MSVFCKLRIFFMIGVIILQYGLEWSLGDMHHTAGLFSPVWHIVTRVLKWHFTYVCNRLFKAKMKMNTVNAWRKRSHSMQQATTV